MSHTTELYAQLSIPSPLQKVETSWSKLAKISLYIKRDDTIHPHICGNKWRKLKYAVLEAIDAQSEGLISYGGAYSNHLVALAATAHYLGIQSCGIVRSYHDSLDNPSLDICRSYGMKLFFVHPQEYSQKGRSSVVNQILQKHTHFQLIPEGGTQESALKGVGEIVKELESQLVGISIDKIYTPIGTGGTMAGMVRAVSDNTSVIGVSPFKGEIKSLAGIELLKSVEGKKWSIEKDTLGIRFGAYSELIVNYLVDFYKSYGIVLDPIYTTRTIMKLEEDCKTHTIKAGSTIVMLHTGGLQGCMAYNHQYAKKQLLIPNTILEATEVV